MLKYYIAHCKLFQESYNKSSYSVSRYPKKRWRNRRCWILLYLWTLLSAVSQFLTCHRNYNKWQRSPKETIEEKGMGRIRFLLLFSEGGDEESRGFFQSTKKLCTCTFILLNSCSSVDSLNIWEIKINSRKINCIHL